jgi:PDZ domain-containing protein
LRARTAIIGLLLLAPATAGEPARLETGLARKVIDRWGANLVTVEVFLQRSEGEDPSRSKWVKEEYSEKRPLEMAGLAVDPRTIWLPEPDLERRFIPRLAVRIQPGKPAIPVQLVGTFLKLPGWVARTEEPMGGVEAIDFASWDGGVEGLVTLGAAFARGERVLTVSRAGGEYWKAGGAYWSQVPVGVLLVDKDLRPVGYSSSGMVGLENAPDLWRGKEIAAGPVIDFGAFDASRKALLGQVAPFTLTVRGFFRHEEEEEGRRFRRFHSYRGGGDGESRNDFLACGYALTPKRVLVNYGLDQDSAIRLERIVIRSGGEERPARFLGAFEDYRAFLIEPEGADLPGAPDLSPEGPLAISQPVIAVTADHQTSRRRDIVELNRISDFSTGYKGVVEPILERFPRPGTVLLGAEDHAFLGAVVEVTRESEDDELHRFRATQTGIDLRILRPAELRRLFVEGKAPFDRRLTPRSSEHEKDMVWLGIDFQPLNRDLARSHGVELATRGGELGLIVLEVHPASPAAQIGLAPGDILLTLKEENEEPVELRGRGDYGREEFLDGLSEEGPEEGEELSPMSGPPWRSPRNSLNERLTRIGEGKQVELVWIHEDKEARGSVKLAWAPPDFENARKYKAEDIGLTVKDITYEVRAHYRLSADAPGVVVGKVERGSKAAIAKVAPFEILVSVNGKVVRNVDEFRQALEQSAAGERTLELKLERMGKSRLVRMIR